MTPVRVLAVASEVYPIVKTGGLADVAGALPAALKAHGVEMRTLMPGYPDVMRTLRGEEVRRWPDYFGGPGRLLAGSRDGLYLFVLDVPHRFARPGNPYVTPDGSDWPDNGVRFGALARVGASLAKGMLCNWSADVVQAHDWQAALLPAFLHYDGNSHPPTVMTVHNLAFQGQYPMELAGPLGLPPESLQMDGVEYYVWLGCLKAGLRFADRITTVSPSYAAEIRTPEGGMVLDWLLRDRAGVLSGILNGIDDAVWDPAADPLLPARFDADQPAARAANTAALRARFGLAPSEGPLFGVISRLSWQKGLDLLLAALPDLLAQGGQLALLGSGDPDLVAGFTGAAAANPGRVGCEIGYDEPLAHLFQGGSDFLVVPSRFEPCGLTQLYAMRYGTVPVAHAVGGLADTVVDAEDATARRPATGFVFRTFSAAALRGALDRALARYRDAPAWQALQRAGMAQDCSWTRAAEAYAALYRDLTG
jgi:starch synthase